MDRSNVGKNISLEVFKRRYGYELPRSEDNEKYSIVKAKSGDDILYIRNNDGSYRRMNSLYDPVYEAERWAAGIEIKNNSTSIILCGLLDGYFLRALVAKARPDTRIIVYEQDEELLLFVLQNFDISDLIKNENIYILTKSSRNYAEILSKASENMRGGIGQGLIMYTPGYNEDDGFVKLADDFSYIAGSMINVRELFARDNFKNYLYALNSLNKNYQIIDFYNRYDRNIPVIVVAGGPSLLKNIDLLKELKTKAVIVATDRAATVLLEHDIMPHCMVTVDGQKDPDFMRDSRLRNIPVFANYSSNRIAQKEHQGNILYMCPEMDMEDIPGLKGRNTEIFAQGGSVATSAYAMFAYIKAKRVILLGQDLAFTGGETHADNRHDEKICEDNLVEVEGIDGKKLYASNQLNIYRVFFESQNEAHPDTELIDATEGGALIHGTTIMTLREVIDKYCTKEYDIKSLFDLSTYPEGQTEEEHIATILYMRERMDELDQLIRLSGELKERLCRLLKLVGYSDINEPENVRLVEKMNDIRRKIYDMPVNNWLEMQWIEDMRIIPEHTYYMRNNEEARQIFDKAYHFYSVLPEECMSLKEAIKEAFGI